MKRRVSLMAAVALMAALLAGCGSQEQSLVSKTPFPEFSEVDMEGNTITNEIFSDYDATIVNFWSNGCGSCIEEMPEKVGKTWFNLTFPLDNIFRNIHIPNSS